MERWDGGMRSERTGSEAAETPRVNSISVQARRVVQFPRENLLEMNLSFHDKPGRTADEVRFRWVKGIGRVPQCGNREVLSGVCGAKYLVA